MTIIRSIQAPLGTGMYLTKNAPTHLKFAPPEIGEKRTFTVKFKPASEAELKALGEMPDGFVAGWASTDSLDSYRHRIMAGAFSASIQKRGLKGPRGVKLLIGHNWDQVAGLITKLEYRGNNLWIEAQLNLELSYAKDAYIAAKMVGGLSFSVGFSLEKYAIEGGDSEDEWLRIDQGDLYEVSVVPFPGNEDATMEFIKSGTGPIPVTLATISAFEKLLVASGLVKSRNDAKRVTQVVKASAALFQKGGTDPAVVVPPANSTPVLAKDKLEKLASLVANMKATLAQ